MHCAKSMPLRTRAMAESCTKTSLLDQLRRLKEDEDYYFPRVLKILTKKSKLKPFEKNVPQQKLKKIMDAQEKKTGKIRVIILKARQEGVSTYVQGKFYHRLSMNKFIKALVVSHELDSAEHIFGMSRLFLQESPRELVPMTRRSNRREILFENPDFSPTRGGNPGLRSHLRVDTAKDVDVGASMTFKLLHLSEVARWLNAKATLTSLLQAVPDEPGTIIVFESTAQGVGGEFHDMYWAAKKGLSEYIAVFLAWFENPEYQALLETGEVLDLDDEEKVLKRKFKLSPEQLKWRRNTIRDKCNGDVNVFHQEYPSTDEEAFVTSGSRKYNLEDILVAEKHVLPPLYIGELEEGKFVSNKKGKLQVWEEPDATKRYVVAGDVGEGIETGDPCVATVWDHVTWEQVAMWRGIISPEEFGHILADLGRWYNNALVAPESNSVGLTSCVILKNDGYPNIYYTRKKDEKTQERTRKIGFFTSARTRNIGIGLLGKALREDDVVIRAAEIISELKTFVVKDNGRIEANEGCHDDCVLSTIIGISVMTELPPADFEAERKLLSRSQSYRGGVASWPRSQAR